ncbi:hypothetical protein T11_5718 [Trichinella zimbabwensis]|uniref:Uncharacterized protein n=1 Tax=Trichinella zimbabwensis TaxID=268475 RepID=A0A0V1DLE6_9BILA|nr:hypothetical protein T11_5718 [Trichinella zimbabwensis]
MVIASEKKAREREEEDGETAASAAWTNDQL